MKSVKFYPQVQLGGMSGAFAAEVEVASCSSLSAVDDVADLRKRLDWRLWNSIAEKDWTRWEKVVDLYKQHGLPLDEVSYSLVLHGYLLSHHHPASVALLVLENMKTDDIHPAIIQLNESLLNSFYELSDIGIRSSANGWQNLTRLVWMSAARLRKKRMRRVRDHLQSLPTSQVLQLSPNDVTRLIETEHSVASILANQDQEDDLKLLEH